MNILLKMLEMATIKFTKMNELFREPALEELFDSQPSISTEIQRQNASINSVLLIGGIIVGVAITVIYYEIKSNEIKFRPIN